MAPSSGLDAADLARAADHGLSAEEVSRQLDLLRSPPPAVVLDRPCTTGDGIETIGDGDAPALLAAHARATEAGRATYFVPASGAATRMFKSLLAIRASGPGARDALAATPDDADAATALRFFDGVRRFAFAGDLAAALRRRGEELDRCVERGAVAPVLAALLDRDGLDYPDTPKGLLPFHRYRDRSRTAFDEHLVEAARVAAASGGRTRLHFTVSPDHQSAFEGRLAAVRSELETLCGARFEVAFSSQSPATDTIAVELDGAPFRDESGEILFRPGGHGALIANLNDLASRGVDLLFVKNIDNVVHDDWREPVVRWRRLLAGRLVVLQERVFAALRALDDGRDRRAAIATGAAVLRDDFGLDVPEARTDDLDRAEAAVRSRLDRPLRVCAMLRAEGDPGGGPFWVRGDDGRVTPQIVETAQIDKSSAEQRALQAAATHFNPADMVLGVRNHRGAAYDLRRHVDPRAVFVAEKSSGGRPLRALEHPGLWNGGMADWNTLFVEVPPEVFQPVKTLVDLLSAAHQPSSDRR